MRYRVGVWAVLAGLTALGAWAGYEWSVGRLASTPPLRSGTEVLDIEQAWGRVHAKPRDPATWTLLGEAQERDNQLEAAEHSFRTAIRLSEDDGVAYARLGFLLYSRGEDSEALALLLEARRRRADVPMLAWTIEALKTSAKRPAEGSAGAGGHSQSELQPSDDGPGSTGRMSRPGDAGVLLDGSVVVAEQGRTRLSGEELALDTPSVCSVPMARVKRRGVYVVDVTIESTAARLVIDTGASMTVLTREVVERAGVEIDLGRRIRAITANGPAEFSTAMVSVVGIGDRVIEEARVAVCDNCVGAFSDGLLGLDLQAAFGLDLDLANERVLFIDCD